MAIVNSKRAKVGIISESSVNRSFLPNDRHFQIEGENVTFAKYSRKFTFLYTKFVFFEVLKGRCEIVLGWYRISFVFFFLIGKNIMTLQF